MLRVAVNGYGTIGKRVADAVSAQPDMEVAGVAKTRPNFEAERALEKGYSLYAAVEDRAGQFEAADLPIDGLVDELVEAADIVVDATPSGIGAENKALYESSDTPAIFQGGEAADLVDTSFTARANFAAAREAEFVRVVSCNTTGLARLIAPFKETCGVSKARVTLVRRGGDPAQSGRGPINDILPDPVGLPSHHGPDVQTIYPDIDIDTLGLKVPATLMHMHSVNLTLDDPPSLPEIREMLAAEDRLFVIEDRLDIDGCGELKEFALDNGRPRGDLWENGIWGESITIEGDDVYLFQAIHQESDVIPENIDAIRAMIDLKPAEESIQTTNDALGIGRL